METTERIIDMMEHPERYSDSERAEIFADDEALKIYLAIVETRMAADKKNAMAADTDAEWRHFAAQHADTMHRSRHAIVHKAAAAVAVLAVLSGIAFAAVNTIKGGRNIPEQQAEQHIQTPKAAAADTARSAAATDTTLMKPAIQKTFKNATLQTMLTEMAACYGKKVVFRNDAARKLRYYYEWDSRNSLQNVIDELNHSEQVTLVISGNDIVAE